MLVYMLSKRKLKLLLLLIPLAIGYFLYVTLLTSADDFSATHRPHAEKSWHEKIKSQHLHGLDLHGGPLHNHADAIEADTGRKGQHKDRVIDIPKEQDRRREGDRKNHVQRIDDRGTDILKGPKGIQDGKDVKDKDLKYMKEKTDLEDQIDVDVGEYIGNSDIQGDKDDTAFHFQQQEEQGQPEKKSERHKSMLSNNQNSQLTANQVKSLEKQTKEISSSKQVPMNISRLKPIIRHMNSTLNVSMHNGSLLNKEDDKQHGMQQLFAATSKKHVQGQILSGNLTQPQQQTAMHQKQSIVYQQLNIQKPAGQQQGQVTDLTGQSNMQQQGQVTDLTGKSNYQQQVQVKNLTGQSNMQQQGQMTDLTGQSNMQQQVQVTNLTGQSNMQQQYLAGQIKTLQQGQVTGKTGPQSRTPQEQGQISNQSQQWSNMQQTQRQVPDQTGQFSSNWQQQGQLDNQIGQQVHKLQGQTRNLAKQVDNKQLRLLDKQTGEPDKENQGKVENQTVQQGNKQQGDEGGQTIQQDNKQQQMRQLKEEAGQQSVIQHQRLSGSQQFKEQQQHQPHQQQQQQQTLLQQQPPQQQQHQQQVNYQKGQELTGDIKQQPPAQQNQQYLHKLNDQANEPMAHADNLEKFSNVNDSPKSLANLKELLILSDGNQYPLADQPSLQSAIPEWVPQDHYIFPASEKEMPRNSRYLPTIANGHVGTVVYSDTIYMNGLYNGRLTASHRARIPSWCSINITALESPGGDPIVRSYALNVAEGVFIQTIKGQGYNITQKMYAHRTIKQLLVVEVDIVRESNKGPSKVSLSVNSGKPSTDVDYRYDDSGQLGVKYMHGQIKETELPGTIPTESHVFYSQVPQTLEIPDGSTKMKWVAITSASYSRKDAEDGFKLGRELAVKNQLYANHVAAWKDVWSKGRIDVSENIGLARSMYGCMYYILSSLPMKEDTDWPFIGLSPGDLAHGAYKKDYEGHVFWDQETWMYPPIQMLYSNLAKIMLNTRTRTLDMAKHNAIQKGLKGAKYPWESAYSGAETSPSNDTATYEIHINGDISLAVRQYLYSTWDKDFLEKESGYDMVLGIAQFWESRSTIRSSGKVEILSVDGPDEYHFNVSNSVFTNYVAKISLMLPAYCGKLMGIKVDPKYQKMAENMYLPYNKTLDYHPEYDGYKIGTQVKQADVILLGYPLMMNMSTSTRRNDLKFYERVTDKHGPTMTWGQFAINWLELKDTLKANLFLKRKFANILQPFQLWTENSDGSGAVNFITGMGDMLQCVLFGYGGIRLKEDRLDMDPVLPLNSKSLNITGVDYLGSSLDLTVTDKLMMVELTDKGANAPPLTLKVYVMQQLHPLKLKVPVTVPRQKVTVIVSLHT